MRPWLPALLLLGGCAAAAPGAAPGAAAHLTMYSADDSSPATVVITGVIGDYGTARRDTSHHRLDLLLAKGTMQLDTAGFDAAVKSRFGSPDINTATCSATAAAVADVAIAGGTGAYQRVAGQFRLTATLDEVYTAPDCTASSPFRAQMIITAGSGVASLS